MASTIIKYRGPLRELTQVDEEVLSVNAVRDVMKHIKSRYGPEAHNKAKSMLIVIDGESMLLRKGFATKLKAGETIQFLPICGGG